MIFRVAVLMFLFTFPCFAEDVFLDLSAPVALDTSILVATFYRKETNDYFFTIVYKFREDGEIDRYQTDITFNKIDAAFSHVKMCQWAAKTFLKYYLYDCGSLPLETIEKCDIDPDELPTKK